MNYDQLQKLKRQYEELQQRLQEPGTWQDPALNARLQKEAQELAPLAEAYAAWEQTGAELQSLEEMRQDPEFRDLAQARQ